MCSSDLAKAELVGQHDLGEVFVVALRGGGVAAKAVLKKAEFHAESFLTRAGAALAKRDNVTVDHGVCNARRVPCGAAGKDLSCWNRLQFETDRSLKQTIV